MKKIYLKPKKEDSLLRYHPWVFSGALQTMETKPSEGEIVAVYSSHNIFLGIGYYQIGSIAIRIISFEDIPIDREFWRQKIADAYQLRIAAGLIHENNNTYRLIHGEGDNIPGLIVDVYGNTAVMQAHAVGIHQLREQLAELIVELVESVQNVYYKSDTTLPFKAELNAENGFLISTEEPNEYAIENGLRFHIDWLRGQKTGFFVDQRDNRMLLEKYAKGKKVLNMFCYTGGFSVYALRGGAAKVCSVDSSAKAIELTHQNVHINYPESKNHEAYADDAFRFFAANQDSYDLIILDPPAFAKHRDAIKNALKGYRRLNTKAIESIQKGGIIFTFSCSQAINKDQFRLAVFSAAAEAKRKVKILHQLTQPLDHPINIYHPEGEYLKGLVLYVE